MDGSGNIYLAGFTVSTFGIASGGFQNTYGGNDDAFLVKFSTGGARLWATYYGGSDADLSYSCTVDGSGNVYLAGITHSSNGIASGGFQNTNEGNGDAFLVKFSAAGARLWATYYGGSDFEDGNSCALDSSGNIFLTGTTISSTGIAYDGFQSTIGGGYDAYLAKISDRVQSCDKPTGLATSNVTSTSAKLSWSAVTGAVGYQYEVRKKGTTAWATAQTANTTKTITGLLPNTTYQWRVIAACRISPDTLVSGYTMGPEFTTLTFAIAANSNGAKQLQTSNYKLQTALTPNPINSNATLTISNTNEKVQIKVGDASGKIIWQSSATGERNIIIPAQHFASGVYMVEVIGERETKTLKMVKE